MVLEKTWVPWTARSNQSIRKSVLNVHWKDWCWSSNSLTTWCEELTHRERPWYRERLRAGGEGGNRRWDGWMASLTQCTWVWANSRRYWRTGKPSVLLSMGSQRVWHDWATEQRWHHTAHWCLKSTSNMTRTLYSNFLVFCIWNDGSSS